MIGAGVTSEREGAAFAALLAGQTGLRLKPGHGPSTRFSGELTFNIIGPQGLKIDDFYDVLLEFPNDFPKLLGKVWETGGRIPNHFHKLADGSLCLGSPTGVRFAMAADLTPLGFVERVVLPYLYGYSYYCKTGDMPFGELRHGGVGIRDDFVRLFGLRDPSLAPALASICGLRRRVANKHECPCGSGRRFGRCHHEVGNKLRRSLGRGWLRKESLHMSER